MDSPSEVTEAKFKIKEQLKLEPTKAEKKFFKSEREQVDKFLKQERLEQFEEEKKRTKDLLCMGMTRKLRAGPHPLSVLKKQIKKNPKRADKPRRKRKGKRDRRLSQAKNQTL